MIDTIRQTIRTTRSVCPVCLKQVDARLTRGDDGVYIEKTCDEHGSFSALVWKDFVSMENWRGLLPEIGADEKLACPDGCIACGAHQQDICCVILEVTKSCNLHCPVCFADGGTPGQAADGCICEESTSALKQAIDRILSLPDKPLIQFSGGEPTLRDDLPELIAYAKEKGCPYTQLNSNGIRLAQDEAYVKALAQAGLSFVFLQFDGMDDEVYASLRGASLYEEKKKAIEQCDRYHIGVVLVPTIVPGINDKQIGDILRFGAAHTPGVRGVHFQPVSYIGRYPHLPNSNGGLDRFTLDELLVTIREQTGIGLNAFQPSRCDHPLCGLHGSFYVKEGDLIPLSQAEIQKDDTPDDMESLLVHEWSAATQNREYIGRRWSREDDEGEDESETCCCAAGDESEDGKACCDASALEYEVEASADPANGDLESTEACCCVAEDEGEDEKACCDASALEYEDEASINDDSANEDLESAETCCCAAEDESESEKACCDATALEYENEGSTDMSLDTFLHYVKQHRFTITAMAFQDAMNLDVERLRQCSIRVYQDEQFIPFCAHYITPLQEAKQ